MVDHTPRRDDAPDQAAPHARIARIAELAEQLLADAARAGGDAAITDAAAVAALDEFAAAREARARRLDQALRTLREEKWQLRSETVTARSRAEVLERELRSVHVRLAALETELTVAAGSFAVRSLGWARIFGARLGRGPLRDRARFAWQVCHRLLGRGEPIAGDQPLHAAIHDVGRLRRALEAVTAPREDAPATAPLLPPDPRAVYIVTPLFLDRGGIDYLFGGAERYHIELAELVGELGYRPVVCQSADFDWRREFRGIEVVGLQVDHDPVRLGLEFHRRVAPGALTIYSSFFLASSAGHPRSLGISHGVFWDHASFQHPTTRDHWSAVLREAMDRCDLLVSVDANTINWVRATCIDRAHKWTRVPNFVDLDEFRPPAEPPAGRVVVLYPRRLYPARGFWLAAEMARPLLDAHPDVDLWFVGQAEAREAAAVAELRERFGERVRHSTLQPDEMADAYRRAHIALIPTVNSEGTSLSCLEAMASGNAVVATNVGGLPELVTDGYNGLLVSPDAGELRDAVERLVCSVELRTRLGQRARATAAAFSRDEWRARWRGLLADFLPQQTATMRGAPADLTWVHLRTPGIRWSSMKQRPHHLMVALAQNGENAVFVCDGGSMEQTLPSGLRVTARDHRAAATRPVFYVYYAFQHPAARAHPDALIVYDVLDDPAIHADSDATLPPGIASFRDHHERLVADADVVLTSSRRLAEELRCRRPDVRLIPNGVWPDHFGQHLERPRDLPHTTRPIAGYYGAIAEWFDYELVRGCARLLPDWDFVLIGPATDAGALARLTELPNLHHLGEKRYEELPAYAAHFDVGMVPFVVNGVTDAVSPLKLYEYAAAGTPIVATDFAEARNAGPTLVGRGLLDFVARLREAARQGADPERVAELKAFAAANSWTVRARVVQDAVRAAAKAPPRSAAERRPPAGVG